MCVQVVAKHGGKTEVLRHFGSAHTDVELAALHAAAVQFLDSIAAPTLDLGISVEPRSAPRMDQISDFRQREQLPLPKVLAGSAADRAAGGTPVVVGSFNELTWQVLVDVWRCLDFGIDDQAFMSTVIARIVQPSAKRQVPAIMRSLGQKPLHVNTIFNCLKRANERDYHGRIAAACHRYVRRVHQTTMVLYDVTTLYFETPKEDDLRRVGMSKERRVDPQIIVGLITDRSGFPLHVDFFHGRTAETTTLIPMINTYCQANHIDHLVVVADAAMLSAKNLDALDAAGIDYIVADRLRKAPYAMEITDADLAVSERDTSVYALVETTKDMKSPTGGTTTRRSVVAFSPKRYRYGLRSLRKQKEKADAIAAGTKAAKQARFVRKQGGQYVVNEAAFDRAQALAGWKSYLTSLPKDQVNGHQIVNYYHELYHVEQAFRMAKTDLRAKPMHHHDHDAIKAHLAVAFAALAMSTHIYQTTGITTPKLLQQHRYDTPTSKPEPPSPQSHQ